MIAPQRIPESDAPARSAQQLRRTDRVRHAAKRRARRSRRRLHRPVFLVVLAACMVLGMLLAYVGLQARVTSLNFALSRAERERTALLDDSMRLDDRIVRLQSPERLAALAVKLRLHDPHVYAVVRVPEPPKPRPKATGLALLGTWFTSSSTTDGVR